MRLWPFKRIQKRAVIEQGNGVSWLTEILSHLWGGSRTSSGIYINEDKALTIAAVFTAVRLIGGTIGSLPLHVYRRNDGGGRDLAMRHWAYPLLHDSPNEYHTAMTWRELMLAHLLLWGNSYNRIEWLGNGSAGALLPLMPWDVTPRLTSGGVKYYEVKLPDGREDLPDDEVLHVPGLSYDGLCGMSVIGKMRDSLGLAKTAEDLAGSFFANGAKVGGILEVPGKMSPEAQTRLVESLSEKYAGKDGAFKAIVLEDGAKMHGPNMMPFRDAQFLEIRKYQRSEILGWYGVPPHLGGDTERSTSWGTGIEQQDIGYAKHTITPWCVRIEQELNRKLFARGSSLYSKFSMDAFLRGDFKSRMEGLQIAVGGPWLTRNEARELEDWNRSTDGEMDEVLTPLNIGTGGAGGAEPPDPATEPAPSEPAGRFAPVTNVSVHLPTEMRHEVTHQHPDVAKLGAVVREVSITTAAVGREVAKVGLEVAKATDETRKTNAAVGGGLVDVANGLQRVAAEVRRPRRAVLDKDGNPIGSEPVPESKED